MDNLAGVEDDAILQQLADDQIEHLVKHPYGKTENRSTDSEVISYVPKKAESDMLLFDDVESGQDQPDGRAKSAKTFVLKSPEENQELTTEDQGDLLEAQPVNSAVSTKVAELISQLQAEKAAEKIKQQTQAKQEAQASQDESSTEAISGEELNPEEIDSDEARAGGMELPLEDIEATFAPQVPEPESTSANLAEEILSRRMAAENVMDEEDNDEKNSDPTTLTPPTAQAEALPESSSRESETQIETGQLKNFIITLAIIASTAILLMLAYYIFFTA